MSPSQTDSGNRSESANDGVTERLPKGTDSCFWLVVAGLVSSALYAWLTVVSHHFEYSTDLSSRPIPLVVAILAAAFAVYLGAMRIVSKGNEFNANTIPGQHESRGRTLGIVIGFAILFRAIVSFSTPIQEVDIYRYIWDGAVSAQGISPFEYPPQMIEDTIAGTLNPKLADERLDHLAALCHSDPALHQVLSRVHFEHLPTVYPATSQWVFTVSEWSTPAAASLTTRVRIMRAWLIGFDVLTILLMVPLLAICQLPKSLCLAYAWCPLVIKEFSNSGHLDSIAVFLTVAAVYLLIRAITRTKPQSTGEATSGTHGFWNPGLLLAAAVLALAVAAKLFPIVLVPLFCFVAVRRCGWTSVILPAVTLFVVVLFLLWPLLPKPVAQSSKPNQDSVATEATNSPDTVPDSSSGMSTFLGKWEMNDLLFMLVIENLKVADDFPGNRNVWFSIVPQEMRQRLVSWASNKLRVPLRRAPFLLTRWFTSMIFLILAIGLAARAGRQDDLQAIGETVFLTLAWFWLLSPTQNPWYWTWALPFLPFVRGRAWFWVSGLTLLYYFRFWFSYQYADTQLAGTAYKGAAFFDFIFPWIEFAPILACLFVGWLLRVARK